MNEVVVLDAKGLIDRIDKLLSKIERIENATCNPLDGLPDLVSGAQIKRALKIGAPRFKGLIRQGLNDVMGSDKSPKYLKSQLINILNKRSN
jgi:hypothetical protein